VTPWAILVSGIEVKVAIDPSRKFLGRKTSAPVGAHDPDERQSLDQPDRQGAVNIALKTSPTG